MKARVLTSNVWFRFIASKQGLYQLINPWILTIMLIMIRLYKDLMKSKKQDFLRRKQECLTKELLENPKSSWKRLAVRSSKPTLDLKYLVSFAEKLFLCTMLHQYHVVKENLAYFPKLKWWPNSDTWQIVNVRILMSFNWTSQVKSRCYWTYTH